MINKLEENIIWMANALIIIVYTIVMMFVAMDEVKIPAIFFGVLLLIFLCASVFSEGRNREGCLTVYVILMLGQCVMCGKLWCGIIFLGLTALYSLYDFLLSSSSKNIFVNLFILCGFFFYGTRRTPSSVGLKDWIILMVLIVTGILWSLIIYFLHRYFELHMNMEKALKSSALEAMNERELRIEIAENKNLAEENARLEERERISRDIHNAVGHTLSAATVTLDAAQMLMDSDSKRANEKIDQANERIHEAIGSVRSVVRTLDSKDDCVLVQDYINSLKELIHNFTLDTEIKVHHNLDLILAEEERHMSIKTPDGITENEKGKLHIGRAAFISSSISELLTNGVKHGKATVFIILLTLGETNIGVQVNDNGTGWGGISYEQKQMLLSNGFGLRKMNDYVKQCGGSFDVDGQDGFCVKMSMPR